jgi:hypothetical protein
MNNPVERPPERRPWNFPKNGTAVPAAAQRMTIYLPLNGLKNILH